MRMGYMLKEKQRMTNYFFTSRKQSQYTVTLNPNPNLTGIENFARQIRSHFVMQFRGARGRTRGKLH